MGYGGSMGRESIQVDVVVVGAGTAGAAAAAMLARAGRSVALLEKQSLAGAGAHWVNGVPPWMFDRAGLDRPTGPELHGQNDPMLFLGPDREARLEIPKTPMWDLHVGRLVQRLHDQAQEAGVRVFERVHLGDLLLEGERPVELEFDHPGQAGARRPLRILARLFVDATGQAAALRDRLPHLATSWPLVGADDTCTAAQQVCKIRDRAGAARFLDSIRALPGQLISFAAVQGSWSISNIRVDQDFEQVDLLAGCIAYEDYPSGLQMIEQRKAEQGWIGQRVSGGQGLIRIRRPYDRLAAPGIALLGEAGCMVFPLHGSGTGSGLVAARILADTAGTYDDCGSEEATWEYQHQVQREIGSVHAAYDLLRCMLQGLPPQDISRLISSGLMNEAQVLAGLDQRMIKPQAMVTPRMPLAALRAPGLMARIAPSLARMGLVWTAYQGHPRTGDPKALSRWSRLVSRALGGTSDLVH